MGTRKIRAVSHIAIGVRDIDRVLPFYRDLLGLRVVVDHVETYNDFWNDPPTDRSRRAVYMRWEDGIDTQYVVLDQQLITPAYGEPAKLFQIGLHHVALWVDDLDPLLDGATAVGGRVVAPPIESGGEFYAEPEGSVVRTVYLADPEGNLIQLDQRLVSSWP
jgi:catechol 2,3-dioxygenase-like lactoylglutathione lyase family enzyme